MCLESDYPESPENIRWKKFRQVSRALHCPTRWLILDCLKDRVLSTNEILECLSEKNETVTSSGLYYHLSELKSADIIEVAGYKEEGGGAPQKLWRLKKKIIEIQLV